MAQAQGGEKRAGRAGRAEGVGHVSEDCSLEVWREIAWHTSSSDYLCLVLLFQQLDAKFGKWCEAKALLANWSCFSDAPSQLSCHAHASRSCHGSGSSRSCNGELGLIAALLRAVFAAPTTAGTVASKQVSSELRGLHVQEKDEDADVGHQDVARQDVHQCLPPTHHQEHAAKSGDTGEDGCRQHLASCHTVHPQNAAAGRAGEVLKCSRKHEYMAFARDRLGAIHKSVLPVVPIVIPTVAQLRQAISAFEQKLSPKVPCAARQQACHQMHASGGRQEQEAQARVVTGEELRGYILQVVKQGTTPCATLDKALDACAAAHAAHAAQGKLPQGMTGVGGAHDSTVVMVMGVLSSVSGRMVLIDDTGHVPVVVPEGHLFSPPPPCAAPAALGTDRVPVGMMDLVCLQDWSLVLPPRKQVVKHPRLLVAPSQKQLGTCHTLHEPYLQVCAKWGSGASRATGVEALSVHQAHETTLDEHTGPHQAHETTLAPSPHQTSPPPTPTTPHHTTDRGKGGDPQGHTRVCRPGLRRLWLRGPRMPCRPTVLSHGHGSAHLDTLQPSLPHLNRAPAVGMPQGRVAARQAALRAHRQDMAAGAWVVKVHQVHPPWPTQVFNGSPAAAAAQEPTCFNLYGLVQVSGGMEQVAGVERQQCAHDDNAHHDNAPMHDGDAHIALRWVPAKVVLQGNLTLMFPFVQPGGCYAIIGAQLQHPPRHHVQQAIAEDRGLHASRLVLVLLVPQTARVYPLHPIADQEGLVAALPWLGGVDGVVQDDMQDHMHHHMHHHMQQDMDQALCTKQDHTKQDHTKQDTKQDHTKQDHTQQDHTKQDQTKQDRQQVSKKRRVSLQTPVSLQPHRAATSSEQACRRSVDELEVLSSPVPVQRQCRVASDAAPDAHSPDAHVPTQLLDVLSDTSSGEQAPYLHLKRCAHLVEEEEFNVHDFVQRFAGETKQVSASFRGTVAWTSWRETTPPTCNPASPCAEWHASPTGAPASVPPHLAPAARAAHASQGCEVRKDEQVCEMRKGVLLVRFVRQQEPGGGCSKTSAARETYADHVDVYMDEVCSWIPHGLAPGALVSCRRLVLCPSPPSGHDIRGASLGGGGVRGEGSAGGRVVCRAVPQTHIAILRCAPPETCAQHNPHTRLTPAIAISGVQMAWGEVVRVVDVVQRCVEGGQEEVGNLTLMTLIGSVTNIWRVSIELLCCECQAVANAPSIGAKRVCCQQGACAPKPGMPCEYRVVVKATGNFDDGSATCRMHFEGQELVLHTLLGVDKAVEQQLVAAASETGRIVLEAGLHDDEAMRLHQTWAVLQVREPLSAALLLRMQHATNLLSTAVEKARGSGSLCNLRILCHQSPLLASQPAHVSISTKVSASLLDIVNHLHILKDLTTLNTQSPPPFSLYLCGRQR